MGTTVTGSHVWRDGMQWPPAERDHHHHDLVLAIRLSRLAVVLAVVAIVLAVVPL